MNKFWRQLHLVQLLAILPFGVLSISNYWRFPQKAYGIDRFTYKFSISAPGCHNFWLKAVSQTQVSILDPEFGSVATWYLQNGWNMYATNFSVPEPAIVTVRMFDRAPFTEMEPGYQEVFLGPCGIDSPASHSGLSENGMSVYVYEQIC